MPGIAEIALAGAPLAGGALLGLAAGNLKAPDVRGLIKQDMDLLDRLPAEGGVEALAEIVEFFERIPACKCVHKVGYGWCLVDLWFRPARFHRARAGRAARFDRGCRCPVEPGTSA